MQLFTSTIRKCFAKCGFVELQMREEGNVEKEDLSLGNELVYTAGTTWTEHVCQL